VITVAVPAAPDSIPLPRYEDYPTTAAYELAFHIARAQRRDELLTREESAAQLKVIEAFIRSRPDRPAL
jgi:hypothetical protein